MDLKGYIFMPHVLFGQSQENKTAGLISDRYTIFWKAQQREAILFPVRFES